MKSQKQILTGSVPLVLAALCLLPGTSSNVLAQAVPLASWACGPYTQNNVPADMGSVVSYDYDQATETQNGTTTEIEKSQIVFSTKGFTYDTNGNVTGYETIVRPSASVQSELSWSGPLILGDGLRGGVGGAAWVYYYARISPKAGAPDGVTVPLHIRVQGFAQCHSSYNWTNQNSAATANSTVDYTGGSLLGSAVATYDQPYAEYDQSLAVNEAVGEVISCNATVNAAAYCTAGNANDAPSDGQAQAYAAPSIAIDPLYAFKDFFFVEYSQDRAFTTPNPLVWLGLQNITNGCAIIQLTAPTNHVYELQAATNGLSTNWQAIALATNLTGTVMFTNFQADLCPQQFYRARVVSLVK